MGTGPPAGRGSRCHRVAGRSGAPTVGAVPSPAPDGPGGGTPTSAGGCPDPETGGTWRALRTVQWPSRPGPVTLVVLVVGPVVAGVAEGLWPLMVERVTAGLVDGDPRPGRWVLGALALLWAGTLLGVARRWVSTTAVVRCRIRILDRVSRTLQHRRGNTMPDAGTLAGALPRHVEDAGILWSEAPQAAQRAVLVVTTLVVLVGLHPVLAAAALVPLVAAIPATLREADRNRRARIPVIDALGDYNRTLTGLLVGVRALRGSGAARRAQHTLETLSARLAAAGVPYRVSPVTQDLIGSVSVVAAVLTVAGAGWWLVGTGTLGAPQVAAAVVATVGIRSAVAKIAYAAGRIGVSVEAARRVAPLVETPPGAGGTVDPPEGRPVGIRVDTVVVEGHDGRTVTVDLTVRPAETVLVTGPPGSGKTLLGRLLVGEVPTGGRVLVGGVPVERIDPARLGRTVGRLGTDPTVWSGTVRTVVSGGTDLDTGTLERAAHVAALDIDLVADPSGWDTTVGERGVTISGGQRQRLALARLVASDPRVVVLDDPVASLDPVTAGLVADRLGAWLRERGITAVICTTEPDGPLGGLADRVVRLPGDPGTGTRDTTGTTERADEVPGDTPVLLVDDPGDGDLREPDPPARMPGWGDLPTGDRVVVAVAVILSMVAAWATARWAAVIGDLVDRPGDWMTALRAPLIAAVSLGAGWGSWVLGIRVLENLGRTVRDRLSWHLLTRAPLEQLDGGRAGTVAAVISADTAALSGIARWGVGDLVGAVVGVPATLVVLAAAGTTVVVVATATQLAMAAGAVWYLARRSAAAAEWRDRWSRLVGMLVEQARIADGTRHPDWVPARDDAARAGMVTELLPVGYHSLLDICQTTVVSAALVGGVSSTVAPGTMAAVLTAAVVLWRPATTVAGVLNHLIPARVGWRAAAAMMVVPPPRAASGNRVPVDPTAPAWELVGVSHRWAGAGADTVTVDRLRIGGDRPVVLRGPTGAGKTTLVDLMCGLRDPTCGRILHRGVPLEEIDRRWWDRTVAVAPQQPVVWVRDTVRANITLGRDIPDDRLLGLVDTLGLGPLVGDTRRWLDRTVDTRTPTSEIRVIGLLRALAGGPRVVVLDETFAGMDPTWAARLSRAVTRTVHAGGGTVVMIAHRDHACPPGAVMVSVRDGHVTVTDPDTHPRGGSRGCGRGGRGGPRTGQGRRGPRW